MTGGRGLRGSASGLRQQQGGGRSEGAVRRPACAVRRGVFGLVHDCRLSVRARTLLSGLRLNRWRPISHADNATSGNDSHTRSSLAPHGFSQSFRCCKGCEMTSAGAGEVAAVSGTSEGGRVSPAIVCGAFFILPAPLPLRQSRVHPALSVSEIG